MNVNRPTRRNYLNFEARGEQQVIRAIANRSFDGNTSQALRMAVRLLAHSRYPDLAAELNVPQPVVPALATGGAA